MIISDERRFMPTRDAGPWRLSSDPGALAWRLPPPESGEQDAVRGEESKDTRLRAGEWGQVLQMSRNPDEGTRKRRHSPVVSKAAAAASSAPRTASTGKRPSFTTPFSILLHIHSKCFSSGKRYMLRNACTSAFSQHQSTSHETQAMHPCSTTL